VVQPGGRWQIGAADERHRPATGAGPAEPLPAPRVLGDLAADLRSLIDTTRLQVARTVNAELVMRYWEIGSRIRRDILGDARAEYGNQIVSTLSRQLTAEYGAGFSRQNLFHMIRFVEA
jgi:hypothetical protein